MNDSDFYESLARLGINRKNVKQITKRSGTELLDLAITCSEKLPTTNVIEDSVFNFVANDQLSGLPAPCGGYDCRIGSAGELARFGALYAQKLVIRNPFERYIPHRLRLDSGKTVEFTANQGLQSKEWSFDDKLDLVNDFEVLFTFEPLVKQGLATISKSAETFCPICVYKMYKAGKLDDFVQDELAREWQSKISKMVEYLYKAFESRTRGFAELQEDERLLKIAGDPSLIEHSEIIFSGARFSKSVERQLKFGSVPLSNRQLRGLKVYDKLIHNIIDDISILNFYAESAGSNYLTSRPIDLELINAANPKRVRAKSEALIKGLNHSLPFIQNLSISSLIRLRNKEGEAFNVYRDAIQKVLLETDSEDPKIIREAFDDLIRPELHKVDRTLKVAKKIAIEKLVTDVVISAGAVSIAIFGGIIPQPIAALGAAAGGWSALRAMAKRIPEVVKVPQEAQKNKFYFLWLAKKVGR